MEKDENLEQTSEKTEAKKGAIPQELIDRINGIPLFPYHKTYQYPGPS